MDNPFFNQHILYTFSESIRTPSISNAHVMKEKMGEDFDYLAFRQRTVDMVEAYLNEHGVELKHGVIETLKTLKARGIKMAVATSTDRERAEDKLIRSGLLPYFDDVIQPDEETKKKADRIST